MPLIELEKLEKMTAGDSELLADMAIMFVRHLPALDARLRFGIENRESNEVVDAAHQLKSQVGYFGATGLQTIASQLESAAASNEFGNVATLNQLMVQGIDQLLKELRTLTKLSLEVEDH